MQLDLVEYSVRPMTVFRIVRFERQNGRNLGTVERGEYQSERVADEVAQSLCDADRARYGDRAVVQYTGIRA